MRAFDPINLSTKRASRGREIAASVTQEATTTFTQLEEEQSKIAADLEFERAVHLLQNRP